MSARCPFRFLISWDFAKYHKHSAFPTWLRIVRIQSANWMALSLWKKSNLVMRIITYIIIFVAFLTFQHISRSRKTRTSKFLCYATSFSSPSSPPNAVFLLPLFKIPLSHSHHFQSTAGIRLSHSFSRTHLICTSLPNGFKVDFLCFYVSKGS